MAASGPTVELDFFRMERETAFPEPPMKLLDRKRSFRGFTSHNDFSHLFLI